MTWGGSIHANPVPSAESKLSDLHIQRETAEIKLGLNRMDMDIAWRKEVLEKEEGRGGQRGRRSAGELLQELSFRVTLFGVLVHEDVNCGQGVGGGAGGI